MSGSTCLQRERRGAVGARGSGARSGRSGRRARARPARRRRPRPAPCFLARLQHAEDAPHAGGALVLVDVRCRPRGGARRRGGRARAARSVGRGVRAGRSGSAMRCQPRGARTCSRSSCPVVGSSRRTCRSSHCTCDALADPAGRRRVVGGLDLDAAVEMHGALRRSGSSETARPAAAAARAAPRQTSPRPGASSCRGCGCRPSARPSDRDRSAPASSVSKRRPRSGVRCVWPMPASTLPLRSGSRTRHGRATTP